MNLPPNALIELWREARARFSNQLVDLKEEELLKRLGNSPNSAGFLIRHVADVELLFAKNVFKLPGVEVYAKTVIAKMDTGEWNHLTELIDYHQYAFDSLERAILAQREDEWHV